MSTADWDGSSLDVSNAAIGVAFQALAVDSGKSAITEGNRIFNCRTGGPYHDTWPSGDVTIRNNYYSNVATAGPAQDFRWLGVSLTLFPTVFGPLLTWHPLGTNFIRETHHR